MTKSDNCSDIQTQGSSQTHHPCFFSSCPCLPLCISSFNIFFMILSLPSSYPTYRHPNLFLNVSWSIVALQYYASFCCIVEWIGHRYAHIPLLFGFPNCSLCGSFAIYVLHTTLDFSYFSVLCLKILWFLFDLPFDLTWSLIDFGCGERIHGFGRKRLPSLP